MAKSITPTPIPPDAISEMCRLARELTETQGYLPALERAVRAHDETLERHLETIEDHLKGTSESKDEIVELKRATLTLTSEVQGVSAKLDVLISALQGLSLTIQKRFEVGEAPRLTPKEKYGRAHQTL